MTQTKRAKRNMRIRVSATLLSIVFLALMTSCGGGGEGGNIGVGASAPSLVSIEVTPADPVIALGTEIHLKATGIYSDNSKKDLTSAVEWRSSDDSVADVSQGHAISRARGTAVIAASAAGVSGSRTLTVTNASLVSIQVTPTNPEAPLGTTRQFTATGVFSDESVQNLTEQVSWSAADGAVASVSNEAGSRGLVTPAGIGSTAVSATRDGVTGSTGFTVTEAVLVSIQITPSHPSAPTGTTLHLAATGVYSDHTTQDLTKQVAWSSSDPSVASVSNAAGSNGLAAALAVGAADVSASLDGVTGSTGFTVTESVLVSIQVTPANPSLARGTTLQLTATGAYTDDTTRDLTKNVTWGSTDPSMASVSNADGSDGLATALAVGSTSVSATLGSVSASTILTVTAATLVSIRVEPADAVTALDVSLEFTATGLYSDGSTQDLTQCVTWSSTDPVVASVSNAEDSRGLATPVGPGSTGVFAALGGLWGSTTLTVSDASLVSLSVTPHSPSIQSGTTIQFTATGYYSGGMTLDITRSAVWKSSDNKVAKVSNARKSRGLAEGDEAGTATISAKLGGLSGTAVLTVE